MPVYTTENLLSWINARNKTVKVSIKKTDLESCKPWHYSETSGTIRNPAGSFFEISGIRCSDGDEQPIILQNEIGYLGIICRRFAGEMHYLMQAKIEPGNINKIQLSPTIQATKSNFTQKHGGKKPAYLDYFINASKYNIVVDQIQSEQSSRFLGKRNRNIIIEVDEDIDVLPSHMWMTLPQIKAFMRIDNLVNMDTRTVLSCLPVEKHRSDISDKAFLRSVCDDNDNISQIYRYINDFKMFNKTERECVPLFSLKKWNMNNGEFVCNEPYSFKVVFCDIEIEGREVRQWRQPLFEAAGIATFGLITRVHNGTKEFLVRATPETGCFDGIELGPTVQREYICKSERTDVDRLFDKKLKSGDGVVFDTLLSEEGGRFYHEQNRNVVMEIPDGETDVLPPGYFWTNYKTLGTLIKVNNCLNIQLRNLLSVLVW